jgi:hypothetical protein
MFLRQCTCELQAIHTVIDVRSGLKHPERACHIRHCQYLYLQFILKSIILEGKILLEAVTPALLHVIVHYVVIKVHVCALLILFIGKLWLLMPLQDHTSICVRGTRRPQKAMAFKSSRADLSTAQMSVYDVQEQAHKCQGSNTSPLLRLAGAQNLLCI